VEREELLNVYDDEGRVIGAQPRRAAKASGRAVGAVNVLIVNAAGEVLLQRRPGDKENAGRWDKSVGGHVSAGEDFDVTAVREASEELFDRPSAPQVVLAPEGGLAAALTRHDPHGHVVLGRIGLQLGLRDVRVTTSLSTTAAATCRARRSTRRPPRSRSSPGRRRSSSTSACCGASSRRTWPSSG